MYEAECNQLVPSWAVARRQAFGMECCGRGGRFRTRLDRNTVGWLFDLAGDLCVVTWYESKLCTLSIPLVFTRFLPSVIPSAGWQGP